MRIYVANVGANSGHRGLFSPRFADGTFEFVPIPSFDEDPDRQPGVIRYRDLLSYNNTGFRWTVLREIAGGVGPFVEDRGIVDRCFLPLRLLHVG